MILQPMEETLESLFRCPFEQNYGLVMTYKPKVCDDHLIYDIKDESETVFNIGYGLYHQIGQQFFSHNPWTGKFEYDRHVSELLSTYFGLFFDFSDDFLNFLNAF